MTITDTISIVLGVFLIIKGFSRGFLASLIGPVALIIGTLAAFIYFGWTKNFAVSLVIGLIGPIALAWILRFFLKLKSDPLKNTSLLSRISGGLLTALYGLAIWVITILILGIIPSINKPLQALYTDIHTSFTYRMIKPLDIYAIDKTTNEDDIKSLSSDDRIQAIMNDPQILKAINEKNYASLMSNPKIIALTQDPKLVKKMMGMYQKLSQEQQAGQ